MSAQTFDPDNVFGEQQPSAFDTDAQPAGNGAKTIKKGGESIPAWLWAVIALMALLVIFVVFRLVSSRRAAQSPAEIAPIVQTPQTPQSAIAPSVPEPEVQATAQPDLATGTDAPALPIPGEDPIAPLVTNTPAPRPEAPAVQAAPAQAQAQAQATPQQLSADERKLLNDRIEALSNDVERLEKKLVAQQSRGGAAPSRRIAPAVTQRKPAAAEKATATTHAPITGLTLKAIVDESAWLQTESGETVMVQPGDVIHGVGTVKAVDPEAGAIRLVDGRVLR